jgi:hypothetical protein
MKFRWGTYEKGVPVMARAVSMMVLGVSVAGLVACGTTGGRVVRGSASSEFFDHLNTCLKAHGIVNPEASASAVNVTQMIPALVGTEGIPVPSGITKAQYETALRQCGVANVQVGRTAITNSVVRGKILSVRTCLANNGFTLPAANFSGGGSVLDTSGIDTGSARWRATAMGCSVTENLTQVALRECMGTGALAGRATGGNFEERLLSLPGCLKRGGL